MRRGSPSPRNPPFPLTLQNESCYTVASFSTTSVQLLCHCFKSAGSFPQRASELDPRLTVNPGRAWPVAGVPGGIQVAAEPGQTSCY